MVVYRVVSNLDYQGLMSDEDELLFKLTSSLGEPLGSVNFPKCHIGSLKDKRGNFFRLSNGNVVVDQLALATIKPVMPKGTEYFPIEVEGIGELTYVNIIVKIDALDAENCSWRRESDGKRKIILGYKFHSDKLEEAPCLFKISEHRFTRLLTVTSRDSQPDDFYTRYTNAGLSGLVFEKLWTNEV